MSLSWGYGSGNWYDEVLKAWKTAGIIPVKSAGNRGKFCSSLTSPGDSDDIITVGASNYDDQLADFSSRGPAINGGTKGIKPDLIAPGVGILSASSYGDTSYETLSGTSMSAPHVAGAIALLMSMDAKLVRNFDKVRDVLISGAEKYGIQGLGQRCGGIDEANFPNYAFGYGRLNVYSSNLFRNLSKSN